MRNTKRTDRYTTISSSSIGYSFEGQLSLTSEHFSRTQKQGGKHTRSHTQKKKNTTKNKNNDFNFFFSFFVCINKQNKMLP